MRTMKIRPDGTVSFKDGNRSWVHQYDFRQTAVSDKDSRMTILNFHGKVEVMASFHNIVLDNTGIPTIFYNMDTSGNWSMQVLTLDQINELMGL